MLIPNDDLQLHGVQYQKLKPEGLTFEEYLNQIYGPWFAPMNRILMERRAAGPVDPEKLEKLAAVIARLRTFSVRECNA